jgi:uncharacterized protein (TIGR02677 family)
VSEDELAAPSRAVFQRVPTDMFAFTTTERADLHTAVMHVFGEANERLATALTFDEVQRGLVEVGWHEPVSDADLEYTLGALGRYGLLERTQNHAAHYASAEEYERKNLQYSLSRKGEAAFEGVQHALRVLSSTGALQTAVLDAIADRLNELFDLLGDDSSDHRRIFAALLELEGHLHGLRTNTKQFNGQLQRLLREEGADVDTFHEVKQATVAYLQEFVDNLDRRKFAIRDALGRVETRGVTALMHRALAGADLPALPGQPDPVPRWQEQRAARFDGLRDWFRPVDGRRARVDDLTDIARQAIVSIMRVLERLVESRRRGSSTATDFRTLAHWFTACPSDEDAHRLFNAAFGLWPARHAHLAHDDAEAVPTSTSWSDAPAVPVSPLLRTHGQLDRVARTARVRETGELAHRRRERARRERAELDEAWRRLATPGPVRLSAFARLDHDAFGRLLELLSRAFGAPVRAGARRATTADGRLAIELIDPRDGRLATIRTPRGRFTGPDFVVSVHVTASAARREVTWA